MTDDFFSPSSPIRSFSAVSDDATLISFVVAELRKGDDDFSECGGCQALGFSYSLVSPLAENLIPGNPGVRTVMPGTGVGLALD